MKIWMIRYFLSPEGSLEIHEFACRFVQAPTYHDAMRLALEAGKKFGLRQDRIFVVVEQSEILD